MMMMILIITKLETYQFKTHCKATVIALNCKYHFARTHDKRKVNVLTILQAKWYSNDLHYVG